MQVPQQRLDITIEWPSGKRVPCPECGTLCSVKDHREERIWRHLDTMQFQTFLHCRVPRSECRSHGAKTISVPWGEAHSRWTLLFEAFALMVLEQVPAISKAAAILNLHWHEVHALRKRAVRRGVSRREVKDVEYLGMDEKSFGRQQRFITVLSDLTGERVLDVAPSKSKEAARSVLCAIPEEERGNVQAVAMDMAAAYESACAEVVPGADIVYDKFHIAKMLSHAVDLVRRSEQKVYKQNGITAFTGKRYLFLRRSDRWTEHHHEQYRNIEAEFGATRLAQSKIGRAWAIKEAFRLIWNYVTVGWARRFFRSWYFWATHSRMAPIISVARTLKERLDGILCYFRHGITNAFSESVNAKIQEIKSAARGFRNFENYRIAILFYCGKLSMKPQ
ncbi:MAG: ISL3 family transposase [Bacteroidota bacterium]